MTCNQIESMCRKGCLLYKIVASLFVVLSIGCGVRKDIHKIISSNKNIEISYDSGKTALSNTENNEYNISPNVQHDRQNEKVILYADSQGNLLSNIVLDTVCITANYLHIAERNGVISLPFKVKVPASFVQSNIQLRLTPKLFWDKDTLFLSKLYFSGDNYTKQRLRGLDKFKRFVSSIIYDSTQYKEIFGYFRLLEIFCQRNIGNKGFGVSRSEAEDYYIKRWLVRSNNRKIRSLNQKYEKWCAQYEKEEDIRLDTILTDSSGDMIFLYNKEIPYKSNMNKLSLTISSDILSTQGDDIKIYSKDTLTYYITSVAQLTDRRPIYIDKIIERVVNVQHDAFIHFEEGKYNIIDTIFQNKNELAKIRVLIDSINVSKELQLDSIIISASCSPEGSYLFNSRLAKNRSQSIIDYFNSNNIGKIKFSSLYIPEDWDRLYALIENDDNITDKEYVRLSSNRPNYDERENYLSKSSSYSYIRENIYPLLRRIQLNFILHRVNMVKDTIHTSEPDPKYLKGIEALLKREYDLAYRLLSNYPSTNLAIAYIGLNRNYEAMAVLDKIKESPLSNYLKTLVFARLGKDEDAIYTLKKAIFQDENLFYRIRLDPEVYALVSKYNINLITN